MITAKELKLIASIQFKNKEMEASLRELGELEKEMRSAAARGNFHTSVENLNTISVNRLKELGYKVIIREDDYLISWNV